MKSLFFYLSIFLFLSFMFSCTNHETIEVKKEIITQRIAYDVNIKNEGTNENNNNLINEMLPQLSTNDYKSLIVKLYDNVKSGEIQAYNYENESFAKIPEDKVLELFEKEWPLYNVEDNLEDGTPVNHTITDKISANKITKLRFLEEWYFENDEFCKKVIAVSPVFYSEYEYGITSEFNPYWIFIKDIKE